ncbi:terminase small subunit [Propylenella binzhouense]|uniref:Uncharacterized protein n=1 Tax=Propylenella binzhouense TaxID=2555902 RepID=A0A964T5N3_9HYPH|nr:terminase small subunit [Propylenella binzhouense]MYZ48347.1 hypothetical protein [Propylenella binzhouense]
MFHQNRTQELLDQLLHSDMPPWRPIPSRKLARIFGVSLQSLANWRVRGTGPEPEPMRRGKGNRIFYKPEKVMAWLSGKEPWQHSYAWLRLHLMDFTPVTEETVSACIAFLEGEGVL